MKLSKPLTVHIPDTRGVVISPYGKGNLKIGANVYTYSRLPGMTGRFALGDEDEGKPTEWMHPFSGTCPGATEECQRICYARRPVQEGGAVYRMWRENHTDDVPPIPADCTLLRIHVGGDFNTVAYTLNWMQRLQERPDVTAWVYTRSWRVPALLPALELLRLLPNVQMFASMDKSTAEMPPWGWRRAWIDGDPRAGVVHSIQAHSEAAAEITGFSLARAKDGVKALICPEETKAVKDCEDCGFCFNGLRNDVVFLEH